MADLPKPIDLKKFRKLHKDMVAIATWTKEKHNKRAELLEYTESLNPIRIQTGHELSSAWEYKIERVSEAKRGNLAVLRGKEILMLCRGQLFAKWQVDCFPTGR